VSGANAWAVLIYDDEPGKHGEQKVGLVVGPFETEAEATKFGREQWHKEDGGEWDLAPMEKR
jgi:hypothetical protein